MYSIFGLWLGPIYQPIVNISGGIISFYGHYPCPNLQTQWELLSQ